MTNKIIGFLIVVLVVGAIIAGIIIASKDDGKENNGTKPPKSDSSDTGTSKLKSTENADITIYYGKGCPHCEKLEEEIAAGGFDEKVPMAVKEVWYNEANNDEMSQRAEICKIPKDDLGVPFMFNSKEQKCYVGEADIFNFIKDQAATLAQ